MDIRMPVMDGYETSKRIRALNRSDARAVPIIAMIDVLGRSFTENKTITIYPIPEMQISLPQLSYSSEAIPVSVTGSNLDNLNIVWSISVDGGAAIPYTQYAKGTLGNSGGEISINTDKTVSVKLTATATDRNNRSFTFTTDAVNVKPIAKCFFSVPPSIHVAVRSYSLGFSIDCFDRR